MTHKTRITSHGLKHYGIVDCPECGGKNLEVAVFNDEEDKEFQVDKEIIDMIEVTCTVCGCVFVVSIENEAEKDVANGQD